MQKLFLGMMFIGLGSFATNFVDEIPNGHYAGFGVWTDNLGNAGSYATYVELRNNDMRVDYSWDEHAITTYLSFWFFEPGRFEVRHQDDVVGLGSCTTDSCTYEMINDVSRYTETLAFGFDRDGRATLSKAGNKIIGDRVVGWQDGLYNVNLGETDPVVSPVPDEIATRRSH